MRPMAQPLAVIVGTRPELIKMAPVVRAAQVQGLDVRILHTGQHYSRDMDGVFFEELDLPAPDANLEVGSLPHGAQIGRMLERLEPELKRLGKPRVLVHGDTNSTAAGALIATRLGLHTGHVEAGLRSNDRSMPEEHNRILTDHLSTVLYAPTEAAAANLAKEGLGGAKVHVTGNTIVDAVQQNAQRAKARPAPIPGLEAGSYILLTTHRQENVDDAVRYAGILEGARAAAHHAGLRLIFPIHPRSRARLHEHGLDAAGIDLVPPCGYLDFLRLQADAAVVLTDSGGLQEESCILGVPCVTLRDNTERPETVDVGANRLAGTRAEGIAAATEAALRAPRTWSNPFGDGHAGERIVKLHMGAPA